ncbi:MAG TPA: hypothetical protein ENN07_00495, partial [candidate division Zixibacteria bacterium]|nr:hypothetical protein [candidate division Zixibacteria bacterium]
MIKAGNGAPDRNGDHVFIQADIFNNSGTVQSGDGNDMPGGSMRIDAETFINSATMRTGARIGYVSSFINIDDGNAEVFNNFDRSKPSSATTTDYRADLRIYADSIDICPEDSTITAGKIIIRGHKVIIRNLLNPSTMFGDSIIDIATTNQPGMVADFSGTHVTGSLHSSDLIRVISNNVIAPIEGMNAICDSDPTLLAGGATFNNGRIFGVMASDTSGSEDSILVRIANLSSAPKVFHWTASSVRGWVTAYADTTDSLDPWESISVYLPFSIPTGLTEPLTDTVALELSLMDPAMAINWDDVLIAGIPSEMFMGIPSDASQSLPNDFAIYAYPNPFNSSVTIAIDGVGAIHELPLRVEIY